MTKLNLSIEQPIPEQNQEQLQNSMMLNGGNTAQEKLDWLLKELSSKYHLIKKPITP